MAFLNSIDIERLMSFPLLHDALSNVMLIIANCEYERCPASPYSRTHTLPR